MIRCFVLGAQGFIGRSVVRALASEGFAVGKGSQRHDASPDEFIFADFLDENSLRAAFAGFDVVVHLAWTSVPQTSTDNPAHDVLTNVIGSLNVMRACVDVGVRRVVFLSSGGAIYGVPDALPIPETQGLHPLSSYGITKLTVEKYLLMYSRLFGLEHVILRAGNAYGEGQVPRGGQGVIAAIMRSIVERNEFVLWGDGTVVRDYIHTHDVARAVVTAAASERPNVIVNIGRGTGVSVNELVELVGRVAGQRVAVIRRPSRPVDVPANILDVALAREVLGWSAEVELYDGLRRQWAVLVNAYGAASDHRGPVSLS